MSQKPASDDAYLTALKWIWGGAGVTLAAVALIWLTPNNSTPRVASEQSRSKVESDGDEQWEAEDTIEPSVQLLGAQPASSPPRRSESRDNATPPDAEQEAQDARANEAITEYERNAELFEERLTRLERELEESGPAEEQEAAFDARVREIVSRTTRVPANVTTRCSETVCEVSLAGQGPTLGFARSASQLAHQLSEESARGSMIQSEALDTDRLIAPNDSEAKEKPDGDSAPAQIDPSDSSAKAPEKVRSIRFLIDIEDLRTAEEVSENAAKDASPAREP